MVFTDSFHYLSSSYKCFYSFYCMFSAFKLNNFNKYIIRVMPTHKKS